jgi:hypothetical protein
MVVKDKEEDREWEEGLTLSKVGAVKITSLRTVDSQLKGVALSLGLMLLRLCRVSLRDWPDSFVARAINDRWIDGLAGWTTWNVRASVAE